MAQLKDLIVNGPSRFIGDVYATTFTGNLAGNANTATSATNAGTVAGLSVHSGRNNEANKIVRTDQNGYLQVGYINSSSGHEKNASNPTYVWGSNSSDSYLRSYQTSSLSVNYATSSGSCSGNAATATKAGCLDTGTMTLYANGGNEINFGGTNTSSTIYFGYRATGSKPVPTSFIFGESGTATLTAGGFKKKDSSASYVLTGDGGHAAISSLSVNYANSSSACTGNAATATNADQVDNMHANDLHNWVLGTNMTYTASTRTFTNTRATNEWATQFYSHTCFKDNCYISFRGVGTGNYRMVGLNSDPTKDANFASIDYCWYLQSGGSLVIYENGRNVGSISGHTTYTDGDEFRIEYSGGNIRYYHNGVLCRTIARAIGSPLYADCSFYYGGSIRDVEFGPIPYYVLNSNYATTSGSCSGNAATATNASSAGNADKLDGVHYQNILERHYSGSASSGTATGWFRIAETLVNEDFGPTFLLAIQRSSSYVDNESYLFSISISFGGGISITQLSGYANTRLITKIRIDWDHSQIAYVDLYINVSSTNNNYYWYTVGCAKSYTTWTADPTLVGYAHNFTTVQGCKSDKGFTGYLTGTASSASKWVYARTITLTGSVTGSVSIDGSGDVSLATTTNHTHLYAGSATAGGAANTLLGDYVGGQGPNYFGKNKVGALMMSTAVNSNDTWKDWLILDCYSNDNAGGAVAFGISRETLGAFIMRSNADRVSWAESAELLGTHNYNSYAPKLDGTGASGTWDISIRRGLNFSRINSEAEIDNNFVRAYIGTGTAWTGEISSMAYAAILGAGNTNRGFQLWATRGNGATASMHYRVGTDDSSAWNTERILIDNETINLYAPSLTGAGASGTWGISISGNAATATKLATSRTLWGHNFDGTGNVKGALSGVTTINSTLYFDSSSNIGIGTASPSYKLYVNGDGYFVDNVITESDFSSRGDAIIDGTVSCYKLSQASDIKYKTNIKQIEYEEALKIIENLNPVTWDWNENTIVTGSSSGFVAQEAEEFIPNAISRDNKNNLSLDYTQLHSYEIRVIQEQQKEIIKLKEKLKILEKLIS